MTIQNFDFSVSPLRWLSWEYDNAENLISLLTKKSEWYAINHTQFWENWITDVFDMRTANEFGLSVWAKILELPLFGESDVSPTDFPAFGYDTGEGFPATSPIRAFGDDFGGTFATDATGVFGIPLEYKRLLLRLRFFKLVTTNIVPEINEFLAGLFGTGNLYALDGLNMTMTYVFVGPTAKNLLPYLQVFDVLPRPAGVRLIYTLDSVNYFGLGEYNLNFNNGSFSV